MSKYDYSYTSKEEILEFIANELAEANRLKRLELDCKWTKKYWNQQDEKKIVIITLPDKELEDKA